MRFHEITSITGKGGLFRIDNQRADGMIVTSLAEGWTKFVSSRKHLFTPLDSIAIYTDSDTIPLLDVLQTMRKERGQKPIPEASASPEDLKAYMASIVPDYDRDKVYTSDMKKLVRWFGILEEHGVLEAELEAGENEEDLDADGDPAREEAEAAPEGGQAG